MTVIQNNSNKNDNWWKQTQLEETEKEKQSLLILYQENNLEVDNFEEKLAFKTSRLI